MTTRPPVARRAHTRALPAGLAIAALLAAAPPARAQTDGAAWLEVDAPADGASVDLPLVEVRGRIAVGGQHDFVLVLDVSDSSLLPSGWDVDGDGPSGGTDPELLARLAAAGELPAGLRERLLAHDFDDSVLAAEIAAARALLARIREAGGRTRVALVAFSDRADVLAPLGSARVTLSAALDRLREEFPAYLRGTNFGDAVAVAHLALQPDAAEGRGGPPRGRTQSILLLSDGEPTLPPHGDRARQHALYAASAAGAARIRLLAFALRSGSGSDVLARMAERSGGRFEQLAQPGDAIARLRRTDLVGLEALRIANATTGARARALRTFPDGSFDAFVELAPGPNRIVLEAATTAGAHATAERVVTRSAAPVDAPAAAALLDELRRRTHETALWAEMERSRRLRELQPELLLEVEQRPEAAPEASGAPRPR